MNFEDQALAPEGIAVEQRTDGGWFIAANYTGLKIEKGPYSTEAAAKAAGGVAMLVIKRNANAATQAP